MNRRAICRYDTTFNLLKASLLLKSLILFKAFVSLKALCSSKTPASLKMPFVLKTSFILNSLILFSCCFVADNSWAQDPWNIPAFSMTSDENGQQRYSVSIQILTVMTLLTFTPILIMMTTSFTRIIIVFAILRQALGLQQTPSNQILVGMAFFLTLFIMAPVFEQAYTSAISPYLAEEISFSDALDKTKVPFHQFMMAQTRESDLELFMRISNTDAVELPDQVPLKVVIPAFITSELKTAFQMGFLLFIPFLIIDLVVASVLMAMGMMMLSPLIVSLPFKIMLFVLVDGWAMVMGSLATSFQTI